jgi:hypothetical protein
METSRRAVDQSLVAKIVCSYVRKSQLPPPTCRRSSTLSINPCWRWGNLLKRSRAIQRCKSGDLLRATMSFASNAAGKGKFCVGISG